MKTRNTTALRFAGLTGAALVLLSSPLAAQDTPRPADLLKPAAETDVLRRLPAGHDQFVFRGENGARSWPLYLTRAEADKANEFRLASLNTVSVLPERSTLTLSINGHKIATVPARSASKLTVNRVRIPSGVLVPGFNSVDLSVTLAHRVDCSVGATYELWALLDPTQTGLVVPASGARSGRSLADIAAEPLAEDGTFRIHLRLPAEAGPEAVAAASKLASTLVARTHLAHPIVDVGPDAGHGPGLDLLPTRPHDRDDAVGNARIVVRGSGYALTRALDTGRLSLTAADLDDATIDQAAGSPEGLATLARSEGARATAGRISFADLGLPTESFSGRRYVRSLRVTLPDDFYPGSYGRARLLIDAAHSADLDRNADLIFRVNGTLVSSLKLRPGIAERFDHETVELPLRFFHPGTNQVAIEGLTPTTADKVCDGSAEAPTRLTIADTSELEFPYLAHLGTLPQLAGAKTSIEPTGAVQDLYLADGSAGAIGLGVTVAANFAAEGRTAAMRYHFAPPTEADPPGIVLAHGGALPGVLARAVEALEESHRPESDQTLGRVSPLSPSLISRAEFWMRQRGFFFATASESDRRLKVGPRTLMVASVAPDMPRHDIGGIALPRFSRDARQWLVITGENAAVTADGVEKMSAEGLWPDLAGQAVALNLDDGRFTSIEAASPAFVVPKRIHAADLRPILGGLMSSNIALSAAALLILLSLLGLCANGLLRSGTRRGR